MAKQCCSALILAAGKGTRMKSACPKVMQPLLEEPMLYYVIEALKKAGINDIAVVVGHGGDQVQSWLAVHEPDVKSIWQHEQLGTGHAVLSAADWIRTRQRILVVNGDMPMLTEKEVIEFLDTSANADIAFMTCDLEDPAQYGRVVRYNDSVAIIEAKDADKEQLAIKEINVGIYLFEAQLLLDGLSQLKQNNSQHEYYIVDLISWGCEHKFRVLPVKLPAANLDGVNSPSELARLSLRMRERIVEHWLAAGVKCVDMNSVWISPRVRFCGEAWLYPNVQIWGNSEIGEGCVIHSGSVLRDTVLKNGVQCLGYVVTDHVVAEEQTKMGPFCYLRDGTHLCREAFAGKFVEIKNSEIGEKTKVPHLSYIGDAVIGADTNIGAATVTCNYDGVNKNPTHIGAHCFIGSDTMFVAPVKVGDGSTVGAGSVITKDVPAGALAVARGKQVVIEGWIERHNSRRQKKTEVK